MRINLYSTTQPGRGIGTELISTAIETLGPNRVRSFGGQLGIDNLGTFNALIGKGVSQTEAVWGTHLGRTARKLGYGNLDFNPKTLEVIFSR